MTLELHLCTLSPSRVCLCSHGLGVPVTNTALFPLFNISWKIYHRTSYSPDFGLRRLHLEVSETVSQLIGCRCTWAICCSVNLSVSRALKWSHPPFHSKIFLVSALCILNLFLTYQHSFPLFGFLSSHDTLPIVFCSRTLSLHLSLSTFLSCSNSLPWRGSSSPYTQMKGYSGQ